MNKERKKNVETKKRQRKRKISEKAKSYEGKVC